MPFAHATTPHDFGFIHVGFDGGSNGTAGPSLLLGAIGHPLLHQRMQQGWVVCCRGRVAVVPGSGNETRRTSSYAAIGLVQGGKRLFVNQRPNIPSVRQGMPLGSFVGYDRAVAFTTTQRHVPLRSLSMAGRFIVGPRRELAKRATRYRFQMQRCWWCCYVVVYIVWICHD
ncbi:hypothetical protein H257_16447 [Aphanomyces astaci]|uniref:Uncharacterized protein n=1 Tax=Aphanomyces astaci TaxID=112090 RepID=W4FKW5_APHAT|nr:hypothetical protein H257_16447 [Aphanomyces astaci]ETV67363.1 hypothetical protein H257_16447 [Aphanomyces astaci]|eukprot:XP_009843178.1 hypothetical protein H257_16447 [Aphanomyces astaci]